MEHDVESVYDSEIAPLMAQIIAICKREGMPMLASFQLTDAEDGPLYCSTTLPAAWVSDWMRGLQSRIATKVG